MVISTSFYFRGAIWQNWGRSGRAGTKCGFPSRLISGSISSGHAKTILFHIENKRISILRLEQLFYIVLSSIAWNAFWTNIVLWNKWHTFMFWANMLLNFQKWQCPVSIHFFFVLFLTKTQRIVSNQFKLSKTILITDESMERGRYNSDAWSARNCEWYKCNLNWNELVDVNKFVFCSSLFLFLFFFNLCHSFVLFCCDLLADYKNDCCDCDLRIQSVAYCFCIHIWSQ